MNIKNHVLFFVFNLCYIPSILNCMEAKQRQMQQAAADQHRMALQRAQVAAALVKTQTQAPYSASRLQHMHHSNPHTMVNSATCRVASDRLALLDFASRTVNQHSQNAKLESAKDKVQHIVAGTPRESLESRTAKLRAKVEDVRSRKATNEQQPCQQVAELRRTALRFKELKHAVHQPSQLQGILGQLQRQSLHKCQTEVLQVKLNDLAELKKDPYAISKETAEDKVTLFCNQHGIEQKALIALRQSGRIDIEQVAHQNGISIQGAQDIFDMMNKHLEAEITLEKIELQEEFISGIIAKREIESELAELTPTQYYIRCENLKKLAAEAQHEFDSSSSTLKEYNRFHQRTADSLSYYNSPRGKLRYCFERLPVWTGSCYEDQLKNRDKIEQLLTNKQREVADCNSRLTTTQLKLKTLEGGDAVVLQAYKDHLATKDSDSLIRELKVKQTLLVNEQASSDSPSAYARGLQTEIQLIREAIDRKQQFMQEEASHSCASEELEQQHHASAAENRQETQDLQHAAEIKTPPQEPIVSPTSEQVMGEQITNHATTTKDDLATLDYTHTTPTTSAQMHDLMEKHGVELPNNLSEVAPEFVEEINKFAETNEAFEKQIQGLQSKPWRETVHSIRMIIENVAVKTIQTIVKAAQYNDWVELREHAKSIGKLEEFEQHMSELIKSQNEYIAAGIKGPLNALERWASAPHHEIANVATGLGHLAYQIGYKLAELEAAADLIEHGNIAEAEKIYTRINTEISTMAQAIQTRLSSMSGPEILEAITEFGIDCFLVGQVFKAGSFVLRNARLSNLSLEEYLAQLSQETDCPIPQNARELVEASSKKYPTEFQGAAVAGEAMARGQAKAQPIDVEVAQRIVSKLREGVELNATEVQNLIKMSPKHARNLKQLERIIDNLNKVTLDTRFGFVEDSFKSIIEWEAAQKKAETLYEGFRTMTGDVQKIARNTGISEEIIQAIKNHMFYNKHLLQTSTGLQPLRFASDLTQAQSWQRLIDGNFVQSDLRLLIHEYTESLIMARGQAILGNAINYSEAHNSANKIHNWQNSVR